MKKEKYIAIAVEWKAMMNLIDNWPRCALPKTSTAMDQRLLPMRKRLHNIQHLLDEGVQQDVKDEEMPDGEYRDQIFCGGY
tara:strand:+ start:108 stop:350 length:243 start_codon:yes stop_codon:yes gene_type:complete